MVFGIEDKDDAKDFLAHTYKTIPSTRALNLANSLDTAIRHGQAEDKPEGVRYIKISDTLAKIIATELRQLRK